jgi:hypothetical protein
MTIPGERDKFIPAQRITRITSSGGADWTSRVLDDRETVEDANLEVCYSEAYPNLPPLRGRPSPERKGYPVLQAGTLFKLNRDDVLDEESGGIVALDLGGMANVGRRTALGGSIYLGLDPDQSRFGVKLRARRWLSRSLGLDLAPGIIVNGDQRDKGRLYSYPGFVGELGLSLGDRVAITGQVETRTMARHENVAWSSSGNPTLPYPWSKKTEATWSLGAKFGGGFSLPGLIASAVVLSALYGGSEVIY